MSSTANLQKIGILGGTFDPPHLGHLRIAQAAMDRFNLQSIYFCAVLSVAHRQTTHRLSCTAF